MAWHDRRQATTGLAAKLFLLAILAALLTSCSVQESLMPELAEAQQMVSISTAASQVFVSPSDGLSGLKIRVEPRYGASGETLLPLAGGATAELSYAPEMDRRFTDRDFHEWPADHKWLGELTGERAIGQSFVSPYPYLNGITLRVATFGGDVSSGSGRIKAGQPVPVLELPVDGEQVDVVPGGSRVSIEGAAEGWASVRLEDGTRGYIDLQHFAEVPPPARVNDRDVTLTLYRESDGTVVRQSVLNAADMHDNSHVTFTFDPIPDSIGVRYRFTLTSPESVPGNAVMFRYSPADALPGGTRFDGANPAHGDLIFRPSYAPARPLWQGKLDSFVWSGLTRAMAGSFPAIDQIEDRYLRLTIRAGEAPVQLGLVAARPPGGQALRVEGKSESPAGGLAFNAIYQSQLPVSQIARHSSRGVVTGAQQDPLFFAFYAIAFAVVVGWWVLHVVRRLVRGR